VQRLQQKLLEEPGGVAQVPLRRTGVIHALQAQILRLQRLDQPQAALAHPGQARPLLACHGEVVM
jgi:hypothetical protein